MLAIFLLALAKLVAAGCSREIGLSAVAAVPLLFICHWQQDSLFRLHNPAQRFVYRRRPRRRRCPKVSVAPQTVDPSSKQVSPSRSSSFSLWAAFSFLFPFWRAFLFRCELSYAINSNHTPKIIMQPKTGCSQLRLCAVQQQSSKSFPHNGTRQTQL